MATPIETGGAHHIRLTVSDPRRSREFYTSLLGFRVLMEFPDGALVTNGSLLLGLRSAPDPNRVGLDHLAQSVASRSDM